MIVDARTDEVIREIASDAILEMAAEMQTLLRRSAAERTLGGAGLLSRPALPAPR